MIVNSDVSLCAPEQLSHSINKSCPALTHFQGAELLTQAKKLGNYEGATTLDTTTFTLGESEKQIEHELVGQTEDQVSSPNQSYVENDESLFPQIPIITCSLSASDSDPVIKVKFNGHIFSALIDTGAGVNVINNKLITEYTPNSGMNLQLAAGSSQTPVLGLASCQIEINTTSYSLQCYVVEDLCESFVLGKPFLISQQVVIDYSRSCVYVGTKTRQTVYWARPVGIRKNPVCLPKVDSQSKELLGLLEEFSDVFETGLIQPTTRTTNHRITLKTPKIINRRCYPLNPRKKALMYECITEMLEAGVIEPTTSAYSSPPVLVERPGKKPRFCVDYRELNSITTDESSGLPRIPDALKDLSQAKVFSILDLKSGYWQIPLEEQSKDLTAFTTPDGAAYRFTVMPFGLKGAPATFQKLMTTEVLVGFLHKFVQVYLDDIIVYSQTEEQHYKHLRLVLERLQLHHLKASPEKCKLFTTSLDYLGYHIEGDFNLPQNKHIDSIANSPPPKTKKQLQSFIGACNWLREYIPSLAWLLAPLTDLLKKDKAFIWKATHQRAFEEVKEALSKPIPLSRPDFEKTFIIQTDASQIGMAAVLYQEEPDGSRRIISHISAKFNPTTQKYHVNEQECLCVLWAIRQFRAYVDGKPFILRTDSRAVTWLQRFKDSKAKLTRWALLLQEFSFTIEHVPGRRNELPDLLSRQPSNSVAQLPSDERLLPPEPFQNLPEPQTIDPPVKTDISNFDDLGCLAFINLNQLDKLIVDRQKASARIQKDVHTLQLLAERPPDTVYEKDLQRHYCVTDGILFRTGSSKDRLVVPRKLRHRVLYAFHDAPEVAHPGVAETSTLISERFYWRRMSRDIQDYIKNCIVCSVTKTHQRAPNAPLRSRTPKYPFQMLSLDILGPYPLTRRKNRYIIFCEDVFSKWVEAQAYYEAKTPQLCQFLTDSVFSRYGVPEVIVTDQGRQFCSNKMDEFCQNYGITQLFSAAYHQQANPAERRIQEFKKVMKILSRGDSSKGWDKHISNALQVLRSRRNRSTGQTPAKLVLGYELPRPKEWETAYAKQRKNFNSSERQHAREDAAKQIQNYQNKTYHNSMKPYITFVPGDLVNVKARPSAGRPFQEAWTGPHEVLSAEGDTTYKILINGNECLVHLNDIRKSPAGNNMMDTDSNYFDDQLTSDSDESQSNLLYDSSRSVSIGSQEQ